MYCLNRQLPWPVSHLLEICALAILLYPATVSAVASLRMQTDLGGVDIELFDAATPGTVNNFMDYVNGGNYEGTFIHRRASVNTSGVDVLQMGGYVFDPAMGIFTNNAGVSHIPVLTGNLPVINEPGISNLRGTIAMARQAGQPDSATSEFFFNLIDNIVLDTTDGGFTVFGQVTNGMNVIDAISALERCRDIGFNLPSPCNNYPDVPLVSIQAANGGAFTTLVEQYNLVHINNIGVDSDTDGIIDSVEDGAPNGGDANSDTFPDKNQPRVASIAGQGGDYVTLESPAGVTFGSIDVLGLTFVLTTIDRFDPNNVLAGIQLLQGPFGGTLSGITQGGPASVTETLPVTDNPNSVYAYGPTPADATPHWYEFDYDGETGAVINGNTVTLNFVDGKRGDGDLQANGKVVFSPVAPAIKPGDNDGIADAIENAGPNGGDGNGDNIPDSAQDYVTSLTDIRNRYVTVEAVSSNHSLKALGFVVGNNFLAQATQVAGLNFPHGFLGFEVHNVAPGGSADVNIILPGTEEPVSYFQYGPTPADPADHLYEFTFDPATGTGAEFNGNIVTLHFVDGARGDADLTANGVIVDPGAPAIPATLEQPKSGGGCSLSTAAGSARNAGAWWLLLLLGTAYAIQCRRRH